MYLNHFFWTTYIKTDPPPAPPFLFQTVSARWDQKRWFLCASPRNIQDDLQSCSRSSWPSTSGKNIGGRALRENMNPRQHHASLSFSHVKLDSSFFFNKFHIIFFYIFFVFFYVWISSRVLWRWNPVRLLSPLRRTRWSRDRVVHVKCDLFDFNLFLQILFCLCFSCITLYTLCKKQLYSTLEGHRVSWYRVFFSPTLVSEDALR